MQGKNGTPVRRMQVAAGVFSDFRITLWRIFFRVRGLSVPEARPTRV